MEPPRDQNRNRRANAGGGRLERVLPDWIDIRLQHDYRTSRRLIREHRNLWAKIRVQQQWGHGEAFAYEPEPAMSQLQTETWRRAGIWDPDALLEPLTLPAARAAVDLALHDLYGKAADLPLRRYLGVPDRLVPTAVSIGILPEDDAVEQAVRWAQAGFSYLKLKIGPETDASYLRAVRRAVGNGIGLWLDANQCWTDQLGTQLGSAVRDVGVLFVEQPLPIGAMGEYPALRRHIKVPIYLDEEITGIQDVIRAGHIGGVDGINVKLSKCGGIRSAVAMMQTARALGLGVLVGCFFESTLSITAASHLQGWADYLDLDACLHLESDPCFLGAIYSGGYLRPPDLPGIGARLSARKAL